MINDIAVVIGGSMAGLWAAQALSDHFEIVLILERHSRLEDTINSTRGRVLAIPNICLVNNALVTNICVDHVENRVSSVIFEDHKSNRLETLPCGFVVDATGKDSCMPQWLEMAGYSQAGESIIDTNIYYATCTFETPEEFIPDWTFLAAYPMVTNEQAISV